MSIATASRWLTLAGASRFLDIPPSAVEKLRDTGRLGYRIRPGTNRREYDAADAERILAEADANQIRANRRPE